MTVLERLPSARQGPQGFAQQAANQGEALGAVGPLEGRAAGGIGQRLEGAGGAHAHVEAGIAQPALEGFADAAKALPLWVRRSTDSQREQP